MRNHELYSLFVSGDMEECLRRIEESLGDDKDSNTYPLHLKGLLLRRRGKLDEALTCFIQVISQSPQDISNLKQVAKTQQLLKRYRQSLRIYTELDRLGRLDGECLRQMGRCYLSLEKHAKALECFEKARNEDPSEEVFLEMFQEQMKWDDHNDALQTISQGLENCGPTPQLLASLGLVFIKTGDSDSASQALEDALKLDPINEATVLRLGCIKQRKGFCKEAEKAYRRLLTSVDSSKAWNNLAMCLFAQEDYNKALSCLKVSLELDPLDWKPQFNMGCCYLHLTQYSIAVFHFKAAVNLNKKHAESWNWLGVALARLGDYTNAEQAYRNSLKLKEDPLTHLKLATLYWNKDDKDNAKTQFLQYLEGTDRAQHHPQEAIQLKDLLDL